jgi:hypothetical protein
MSCCNQSQVALGRRVEGTHVLFSKWPVAEVCYSGLRAARFATGLVVFALVLPLDTLHALFMAAPVDREEFRRRNEEVDRHAGFTEAEIASFRIPGALGRDEVFWRDHQSWLKESGYELRPRYQPDWKPSWHASGKSVSASEDGQRAPVRETIQFVRVH